MRGSTVVSAYTVKAGGEKLEWDVGVRGFRARGEGRVI